MKYDIGIVGLGYVGLTFATALADLGFSVLGIEKRKDIVDLTNSGKPHFSEAGLESIMRHVTRSGQLKAVQALTPEDECDIYVITVGTPLDENGNAQLDYIRSATREVADNMPDGALVILRSTVKIGVSRNVVKPILEESGKSFHIAMCPERTLEGRAMQELRQLPQIVGADDAETRDRAVRFFYQLTRSVVQVGSLETAEIIKLVDNTYRDVQFGFANEVARICDVFGVNANEVISGGKFGYPRTDVALPGLVGGPCLEKDPHILTQSLAEMDVALDITPAARAVNENQPAETVRFIADRLSDRDRPAIALLGMAFKGIPATNDLRGSMSLKVLAALRAQIPDADIRLYDPVCSHAELREVADGATIVDSRSDAIAGADCMIIANNHPDFGAIPPVELREQLAEGGFIFDYWNHFSSHHPHEVGDAYYAVGNLRKAYR
ncbi:nucleotide sugar dehydrogenase [Parasphingopyxis algicola]|uniref:nucleotide sugar dehydrogenase n=1 Tax=Parasphingopyxis algicola TaxID=2026624 RepID=UPI0015A4EB9F|nr:nucleotide sugar dehydrogenase [Parasphingopyxis algicola]QLC25967.1 nucleotide sugar dehydrogenase [Parasphingopyxis algicola]